jgi:Putative metal-binding motif
MVHCPEGLGLRMALLLAGAATACALFGAVARAADGPSISQYVLPADAGDLTLGGDGSLWVTTYEPSAVLRVNGDGAVTARYLQTGAPSLITTGADGSVWFPLRGTDAVPVTYTLGRLSMSGTFTSYPFPTAGVDITALTLGPDGNLWMAESGAKTAFVRFNVTTKAFTEFPGPAGSVSSMAASPSGLWFQTDQGLGSLTTAGLPGTVPFASRPRTLAGAGRSVWFTALTAEGSAIGRYTEGDAGPTLFHAGLSTFSWFSGLTPADDGNVWFTSGDRLGRLSPSGRVSEFLAGTDDATDIVRGANHTVWYLDYRSMLGRITLQGPTAATAGPPGVDTDRATLFADVNPRGSATTVRFEYGRTASYGSTTPAVDVQDGDTTARTAADVTGLTAATTYHYRVVATSPVGTATGDDRTFTTDSAPSTVTGQATAPIPPPSDADGDGYPDEVDCRPADARIHQGAAEVAGDGIDQDCSGRDLALTRFFPHVDARWSTYKRRGDVVLKTLKVYALPKDARVDVRCTGRGCRFSRATERLRRPAARLDLLPGVRRSRLRRGAVLEVRLSRPGQIATILRWTIGPPPHLTIRCLAPGATKEKPCA